MTQRVQLVSAFDTLLQPERFKDYCPNGLQVEGRAEVRKLVSGVTASLALIEAAAAARADALVRYTTVCFGGATTVRSPVGCGSAWDCCCNTTSTCWRTTCP